MSALAAGQKIHAIKLLRDETGMGLAQAKRIIEMAAAKHPEMLGRRMISEPTEEGSGLRVFVVVAALLLLGYYLVNR